jgi:hypothetical protein
MNKKIFLLLTISILFIFTIQAFGSSITWKTYSNARFGYEIKYPTILTPQEEAENRDGRTFLSSDGKKSLTVYGGYNVLNTSLDDMYKDTLSDYASNKAEVTYKVKNKSFFIISGYEGKRIFYRKTIRLAGTDNNCDTDATFIFYYPESEKKTFDKITETIAKSFCFKKN